MLSENFSSFVIAPDGDAMDDDMDGEMMDDIDSNDDDDEMGLGEE